MGSAVHHLSISQGRHSICESKRAVAHLCFPSIPFSSLTSIAPQYSRSLTVVVICELRDMLQLLRNLCISLRHNRQGSPNALDVLTLAIVNRQTTMCEKSWPQDFVSLYGAAVPASLLDQLQREASSLADCPNFWIPAVSCHNHACIADTFMTETYLLWQEALSSSPVTTAEEVVSHLYNQMVPAAMTRPCSGAEWWVQVLLQRR